MKNQQETQRDWLYLLPCGQSVENMKSGRLILSEQSGHDFSSESFRHLVKNGVIKKINKINDCIIPQSDAIITTTPSA